MSGDVEIPGSDLLHLLATALIDLSKLEAPGDPVYPRRVQQAYNLLTLTCLRQQVTPPASVPELASWAANSPPSAWGVGLDLDESLLDDLTRMPTDVCREWRMAVADPLAERFENELIGAALKACRDNAVPESYVAFRRLLIERPVMTRAELDEQLGDVDLLPVADLLPRCYPEAATAQRRDGGYVTCGGCGCLLRPQRHGGWACELDRCRHAGESVVQREISAVATRGVHQLSLPLRSFITGPGLVEIELERALHKLGLTVDMWPGFDAYDLGVTFADGTVWAVDAKDRADARLLGRTMTAPPDSPRWHRFFLVVPDHRFSTNDGYRRDFERHCPDEIRSRLRLCSVREFLAEVRRHLRTGGENHA